MIVAMERKLISELIDDYKQFTCLWRIKDPDYKNKDVKNEAYESLLQLIRKYNENFTMDDLKRKIANLRTCYLREFKKVTDAKRYGAVYEPSLWYYKSLEFLNDQHQGEERVRLGRSYNSDDDNESNETPILVYEDHAGSEDKEVESCSPEPEQHDHSAAAVDSATTGRIGVSDGSGSGNRRVKRRRRVLDMIGGSSGLSSSFTTANVAAHVNRYARSSSADYTGCYEPQILGGVGGDPAEPPVADYYDGFGRYVANELRQMDRQSVIIAKRLINEVLFLGQMGMLTVNTRIETPPNSRRKNTVVRHHQDGGSMQLDSGDLSPIPSVELMETS